MCPMCLCVKKNVLKKKKKRVEKLDILRGHSPQIKTFKNE
jgi:hypothetical protein